MTDQILRKVFLRGGKKLAGTVTELAVHDKYVGISRLCFWHGSVVAREEEGCKRAAAA